MKKITVGQIKKATGGILISGEEHSIVSVVDIDSRNAVAGFCFFALPGERRDGHEFIGEVFARGGVCAVVTDRKQAEAAGAEFPHCGIILVDDGAEALRKLAAWYISGFQIKKAAVTGSNGKTTTKDMLHAICSEKYIAHKTPVNKNNDIGLPLTVLSMPHDTQVGIFEMGMDRFGEIHTLAEIVKPNVCVITNVGTAHMERLGGREGILKAKLEITDFLSEEDSLIIHLGGDLLTKEAAAGPYKLITSGMNGRSDYIVSDIDNKGEKGMEFTLEYMGKTQRFKLNVPGEYNVMNAALAVAAAGELGIGMEEAARGLLKLKTSEKRMDIRGKDGIKVIDDTYNASPPAMKAAIDVLMSTKGMRKVAILGDMFELGEERDEYHRSVGIYAGEAGVELLVGIGEGSKATCQGAREYMGEENVMHFEEKDAFIEVMQEIIKPGDVVLVKGSRGMAMEKIVRKILE